MDWSMTPLAFITWTLPSIKGLILLIALLIPFVFALCIIWLNFDCIAWNFECLIRLDDTIYSLMKDPCTVCKIDSGSLVLLNSLVTSCRLHGSILTILMLPHIFWLSLVLAAITAHCTALWFLLIADATSSPDFSLALLAYSCCHCSLHLPVVLLMLAPCHICSCHLALLLSPLAALQHHFYWCWHPISTFAVPLLPFTHSWLWWYQCWCHLLWCHLFDCCFLAFSPSLIALIVTAHSFAPQWQCADAAFVLLTVAVTINLCVVVACCSVAGANVNTIFWRQRIILQCFHCSCKTLDVYIDFRSTRKFASLCYLGYVPQLCVSNTKKNSYF